jgi:hypothetical protein
MTEGLATMLWVLLPLALVLLLLILLTALRMVSGMRRIERLLEGSHAVQEEAAADRREAKQEKQSEFEDFLNEDGKRRMLSKREQAEAFRVWRRQQGKTWGAAD